jgi:hypothetical protein
MPRLALFTGGVTGGVPVTGVLGALPFCVFVEVPPVVLEPLVLPEPVVPVEPEVDVDPEPDAAAGVPDELASDPPQALNNNVKATATAAARK